ncbi:MULTISPECIES: hypothetical protein [Vibrio]|uniref:hypothetical protein n=1 Tax=Vibrio TaxID=662 RepID=UPI001C3098B8|nr:MULTISPECIES: hypothetical protein [Vibrio]
MEPELMISLEGFSSESDANSLGNTVMSAIRVLHQQYQLDISGLKRVVISTDFASALTSVKMGYGHVSPSSFTNSKQAKAIAQLVTKGAKEEFTLVLDINFFSDWFNSKGQLEVNESNLPVVLHLIHHELIHIHEKNVLTQLDSSRLIDDYDDALLMSATRSWSEYLANLKSANSAPDETIKLFLEQFQTIIKEVPDEIASLVGNYQNGLIPLDKMYIEVKDRIKLITNSYAYAFGYIDAFNIDLDTHFPEIVKSIKNSQLSNNLLQLGKSFKAVTELYDQGLISSFDDFNQITKAVDNMFNVFGLTLERTFNKAGSGLYIHVK